MTRPKRKAAMAKDQEPPTKVAAEVCLQVMEDVMQIAQSSDDFAWQWGRDDFELVDKRVWFQLRQLWESKMRAVEKSKAEEGQFPDRNGPSNLTEEYEKLHQSKRLTQVGVTNLPLLSRKMNPLTIHRQASAPSHTNGGAPMVFPCIPLGPGDYVVGAGGHGEVDIKPVMATPYYPQSGPWMANIPMNPIPEKLREEEEPGLEKTQFKKDLLTTASGKRKQQDRETSTPSSSNGVPSLCEGDRGDREGHLQGSGETSSEPTPGRSATSATDSRIGILRGEGLRPGPFRIPQLRNGVLQEDYNFELEDDEPKTVAEDGPRVVKVEPAQGDYDNESNWHEIDLTESSDVHDLEFEDEEKACGDNLVMSLFERVAHKKTKWKCTLKNGIMCLNGQKYVFGEANGEVEF